MKPKMTLAENVAHAQAVIASWSPERRANVQLQGPSSLTNRVMAKKASLKKIDTPCNP